MTQRIKEYLASERRQKYSMCIWRHYPELDEEKSRMRKNLDSGGQGWHATDIQKFGNTKWRPSVFLILILDPCLKSGRGALHLLDSKRMHSYHV